jgi:hypothetical protein
VYSVAIQVNATLLVVFLCSSGALFIVISACGIHTTLRSWKLCHTVLCEGNHQGVVTHNQSGTPAAGTEHMGNTKQVAPSPSPPASAPADGKPVVSRVPNNTGGEKSAATKNKELESIKYKVFSGMLRLTKIMILMFASGIIGVVFMLVVPSVDETDTRPRQLFYVIVFRVFFQIAMWAFISVTANS